MPAVESRLAASEASSVETKLGSLAFSSGTSENMRSDLTMPAGGASDGDDGGTVGAGADEDDDAAIDGDVVAIAVAVPVPVGVPVDAARVPDAVSAVERVRVGIAVAGMLSLDVPLKVDMILLVAEVDGTTLLLADIDTDAAGAESDMLALVLGGMLPLRETELERVDKPVTLDDRDALIL
jgi:hypothetical protein